MELDRFGNFVVRHKKLILLIAVILLFNLTIRVRCIELTN